MAAQHALLVGVSDYADERIPDLDGPAHDVNALKTLLVANWGFNPAQVTTLVDSQATEAGIIKALKTLYHSSAPGDDLLIYFSGHGTSAQDPDLGARLHLPDGSGALITHDLTPEALSRLAATQSVSDGLLVGRFELKPLFTQLNADRRVLVIFDTCFSGNTAREFTSEFTPVTKRYIPLEELLPANAKVPAKTPSRSVTVTNRNTINPKFDYQNLVYFGAAAENQLAVDYSQADINNGRVTTFDGNPHGGFTNALLHVLGDNMGNTDALTFSQMFTLLEQKFSLLCKACGHDPVSLPVIENDVHGILTQRFLHRAQATPVIAGAPTPADTAQSSTTLQVAAIGQRNLSAAIKSVLPDTSSHTAPDLLLNLNDASLEILATNGNRITEFPASVSPARLSEWLHTREWLKQRLLKDQQQSQHSLRVDFRHPLQGKVLHDGESIYFTLQSAHTGQLGALVMNSSGELSVLYPATESELGTRMKPNVPFRIPAEHEPDLRATLPWGSDTVLFYALPADSTLHELLYSMAGESAIALSDPRLVAFERSLDSGVVRYSAASTTLVTTP